MDIHEVPDFDNLPPVEGMPRGCAWGIFDRDGKKDVLGTLNFITPECIREAAKEVTEGVSISLKLVLSLPLLLLLVSALFPGYVVLSFFLLSVVCVGLSLCFSVSLFSVLLSSLPFFFHLLSLFVFLSPSLSIFGPR
jgi:hypothetical protein